MARGRSGFVVVPRDEPVVYDKAGEQVSARKPFAGRWEERYRLGERFEIWLTRT